jgi:hypothetical protein
MDYVNDYIFDGDYILLGEDGTVRTNEGYPVLQYATGNDFVIQRGQHLGYGFLFGEGWEGNICIT